MWIASKSALVLVSIMQAFGPRKKKYDRPHGNIWIPLIERNIHPYFYIQEIGKCSSTSSNIALKDHTVRLCQWISGPEATDLIWGVCIFKYSHDTSYGISINTLKSHLQRTGISNGPELKPLFNAASPAEDNVHATCRPHWPCQDPVFMHTWQILRAHKIRGKLVQEEFSISKE